jgi:adenylate cyclase
MAIGQANRGVAYAEQALRLNPHHPDWYVSFLAAALFADKRYEESHAMRSRGPAFIDSYFFGAACLAHMGRLEDARRWADNAVAKLAATPGGALAIAEGRVVDLLLENNPFCRQEDRDHFAEGMRKAGVPGQSP